MLLLSGRDRPLFWVCYPGATSLRAARQSSLDGCLHEFGREERERDRHIDLSNAAFIPRRRWLDEMIAGTVTSVEQIAARDKCSIRQVNMTISLAQSRSAVHHEGGAGQAAMPGPKRRLVAPG